MAKLIEAKSLDRIIWRTGPYVYFYDGKCSGYNKTLVDNMNRMATNHPDLKVFVIDWMKKREFFSYAPDDQMNAVYLFFDGKQIERIYYPNLSNINHLFEKAVQFYNQNIDRRIKNIGSQRMTNNLKEVYLLGKTPNYVSKTDIGKARRRATWFNNKKIKFIPDQILDLKKGKDEQSLNNFEKLKYKNSKNKNVYLYTKIFKNNRETAQSKIWYHNVQITDMPSEFLVDKSESILPPKY